MVFVIFKPQILLGTPYIWIILNLYKIRWRIPVLHLRSDEEEFFFILLAMLGNFLSDLQLHIRIFQQTLSSVSVLGYL